jgi:hypothetical protein
MEGGRVSPIAYERRRSVISAERRAIIVRAKGSTLSAIHKAGEALVVISGITAGVLVLMSISNTPNNTLRITAIVCAGLFVLGFILRSATMGNRTVLSV